MRCFSALVVDTRCCSCSAVRRLLNNQLPAEARTGQVSAQPWSRSTLPPPLLNDCTDTGSGCRRAFTILSTTGSRFWTTALHNSVLVSSDVCILSTVQYDRVSELLDRRYGINPLTFWWSATHTHSAPETSEQEIALLFLPERFKMPLDTAYVSMFERKLVEGIARPDGSLLPPALASAGDSRGRISTGARFSTARLISE